MLVCALDPEGGASILTSTMEWRDLDMAFSFAVDGPAMLEFRFRYKGRSGGKCIVRDPEPGKWHMLSLAVAGRDVVAAALDDQDMLEEQFPHARVFSERMNRSGGISIVANAPQTPCRLALASICLAAREPAVQQGEQEVHVWDFEKGMDNWRARGDTVKVTRVTGLGAVQGSSACLHIEGPVEDAWNYAGTYRKRHDVDGGLRYRFSAWVRVDEAGPGHFGLQGLSLLINRFSFYLNLANSGFFQFFGARTHNTAPIKGFGLPVMLLKLLILNGPFTHLAGS